MCSYTYNKIQLLQIVHNDSDVNKATSHKAKAKARELKAKAKAN